MARRQPVSEERIDIYDLPVIPRSRARQGLEAESGLLTNHFLSTVDGDGNPMRCRWVPSGSTTASFVVAGAGTRKARNLARNRGAS